MKTGEEKFDDEIRQKLRHSEVSPPAGFFDQIVPPNNKKRGFFWIWIAGIVMMGLTFSLVKFEHSSVNYKNRDENINAGSEKLSAENLISNTRTFASINSENNVEAKDDILKNTAKNSAQEIANDQLRNFHSNVKDHNTANQIANNRQSGSQGGSKSSTHNKRASGDYSNNLYGSQKNVATNSTYNYNLLYIPATALPYHESSFVKQQIRILKPENSEFNPHTPTPFGIEIAISKLYGYTKTTSETSDTMAVRLLNSRSESDANSQGFEIGAVFSYELSNKFKLSAGVHYSDRKQDFNFDFNEYYNELNIDTIQYYILFPFSPPQLVTEYDSTTLNLSRTRNIEHHLIFKSVSVSADLRYQIPAGSFLIEPNAGIIADVYSKISGTTNFNSQFEERKGEDHFDSKIQARVKGGIQIGYSLNEKYNVFINSEYQYALTSMNTIESFYSEKTNILSVGAGIKYTIFKSQAAKP